MSRKHPSPHSNTSPRRIVGFSLPPRQAAEVKIEAARRNISLRKLFGEMWDLYKNIASRTKNAR